MRDIVSSVQLFERIHGSGLFMRGETQTLALTTLAPPGNEQLIDTIREQQGKRRFMLHYNFPKFSVGEAGFARGPGRREIGHGALAHKAIARMLPPENEFPYTIRVVCETLSSNGSTSMAATCAAVLSLMDAGVKLKKPVAGIAMGLMTDEVTGDYIILTDIQGPEDHQGDMDLKVAGTTDGVTALQMDVKIEGITKEIFKDTLEKARVARLGILKVMFSAISAPREEISPYAPKLVTLKIDPEKIGLVIGPGGKTIRGIVEQFENKVEINIDEDGTVTISAEDKILAEGALNKVKEIVREFKVGEKITGKIIKVLDFGAILDLGRGKDGMIHVSELSDTFVKDINDVIKVGDEVTVKVIKVENGKIGLSLK